MNHRAQLVVGTAGHIDHGKSRLVLALTGTDPDRLPEEKARGMTIDIGFAHLQTAGADIWFVDVPGHERFIRNMVAGATGVDVALLVVAADDSVMPQTREHAELLALLGVRACLLVLTKVDLVDAAWAAAVEDEARALLAQVGITPLACVHTSAQTGAGLDDLRSRLTQLASERDTTLDAAPAWFRLPIDRAFTIAGRGTVVTGSVSHGGVQRGDELELWPAGRVVRIRDLQSHNEDRPAAAGRMRLALNLAGVALDEVTRGHELATPGYLSATRRFDAWMTLLRMPGKTPRQRLRVRLHAATSELLAEVRLVAKPADAEALRNVPAQIITAEPLVVDWNQRFVIRDESGSRTLGGGAVLRPVAELWTTRRPPDGAGMLRLRAATDAQAAQAAAARQERVEQALRDAGWQPVTSAALAARAGLADDHESNQRCAQLLKQGRAVLLEAPGAKAIVHLAHLTAAASAIAARLTALLAANPRLPGVPRGEWTGWMPRACPAKLRPVLADWLITAGHVAQSGAHIVPRGHATAMSPEDQKLLDGLLAEFHTGAFQPPALEALTVRTPRNEKRLRQLVDLAAARGLLVRIGDGVWLHAERWTELCEGVATAIRARGAVTVAEVRELTRSSRKFVVPLLEKLDAAGVTKRVGDQRALGPKAPASR